MSQINIRREDALRILASQDPSANARILSALAIAYMELAEHADDADWGTRHICKKLAHMCARELYDVEEDS